LSQRKVINQSALSSSQTPTNNSKRNETTSTDNSSNKISATKTPNSNSKRVVNTVVTPVSTSTDNSSNKTFKKRSLSSGDENVDEADAIAIIAEISPKVQISKKIKTEKISPNILNDDDDFSNEEWTKITQFSDNSQKNPEIENQEKPLENKENISND
jgi:hypothetical protein